MIVDAVIPAAGQGLRLGSAIPKPLVKIWRSPILTHTINALAANDCIKKIIIAVAKGDTGSFKQALGRVLRDKNVEFVAGGATRRDSVTNCLEAVSGDADFILIHDAVRPFIAPGLIDELILQASRSRAAVCGVPVKSTVKIVDINSFVSATLDRRNLWEIQTPQVFERKILLDAYARYAHLPATDDASLVERLGIKVKVVTGSYLNIKITTREDLLFAQAILKAKKSGVKFKVRRYKK